ncbi:MAG TPA: VOC family protein [Burkholderiaceae bacterium]|nr:VOC family protein [Burkholderiaceae bacterium]
MSDFNSEHNRAVWFDIPVADLERAASFYRAVLAIQLHREQFQGGAFYVLEHAGGNGGCLVVQPSDISAGGILVYLNVDGRIRDAVQQAGQRGGRIIEPIHPIGPHGFRAVVLDCEGNRVALHSQRDA